ncbi:HK97-gp10 family putative phage morphogenesis protein [Acidovorax sp.]|uniref:HK97-gp10 family putative phage morphogenesis protein n=1 Tax=Acidovorax sp. TaxID=1872122 RepID=UPI003CFF6AAD
MIGASLDLSAIYAKLDGMAKGAKAGVRPAAQAGAQVYQAEVRARVPVSAKAHKSGKKTYDPGTLRRAVYQAYADDESSDERATYRISWNKSHAFYGKFLEFGTSKMAAQPFLRPGYDSARSRAISAVQHVLQIEAMKGLRS